MDKSRIQSTDFAYANTKQESWLAKPSLYRHSNLFQIRAPLLPIESYLALSASASPGQTAPASESFDSHGLTPLFRNVHVQQAIAFSSLALFEADKKRTDNAKKNEATFSKSLRYLIRMSTRPTPFGLFSGVALGAWGLRSDLGLSMQSPRRRIRPDMGWLLSLVLDLEQRPEILRHLRLQSNSTAFIKGGYVFLVDKASAGEATSCVPLSFKATRLMEEAMVAARQPVFYEDLLTQLLSISPGVARASIELLIADLLKDTLLISDLRPPLTISSPVQHVLERLADVPSATKITKELTDLLRDMEGWARSSGEDSVTVYQALVAKAKSVSGFNSDNVFQVDSTVELSGHHIIQSVGEEAARAAEILLRLCPLQEGFPHIREYRRAFEGYYGQNREVPLLELLHSDLGLGPPLAYTGGQSVTPMESEPAKCKARTQTLVDLACDAMREGCLIVELDDYLLKRLETWSPSSATAPYSLDICFSVAAASTADVDSGKFKIVLGPNYGAMSAGRTLGRFADLFVPQAGQFLRECAEKEECLAPEKLWAELVYLPRDFRLANVAIRPCIREHETIFGLTAGVMQSRVVPIDELVVGMRQGCLYVRWPAVDKELVICAGHMLNNANAPQVCRFLAEITQDGQPRLARFSWGPAETFPILPRVVAGRIVVRPARWRIDKPISVKELACPNTKAFQQAFARWRKKWRVPRYVYLSGGDNRLLLDLSDDRQAEELRKDLRRLCEFDSVVLEEVFPTFQQSWVRGPGGHFMVELVASLIRRESQTQGLQHPNPPQRVRSLGRAGSSIPSVTRLRPPGSEWLYLKLYSGKAFEDDLIAGPIRVFCGDALRSNLAKKWFFVRYSDPVTHIRLRFRGEPETLLKDLLPAVCSWASNLVSAGVCSHFAFDTYDREIERYGGLQGMEMAETIFGEDSRAVAELLNLIQRDSMSDLDRLEVAVISVDDFMASFGMDEKERLLWYREQVESRRAASTEYRAKKVTLRQMLCGYFPRTPEPTGGSLLGILTERHAQVIQIARTLSHLDSEGELSKPLRVICRSFVHLHLNRLMGSNRVAEQTVLSLLWRVRQGLDSAPNASSAGQV